MDPEAKLRQLGMNLPAPPKPMASYRTAVRSGSLLYVAGTGPTLDGKVECRGKLGAEVNVPRGYNAARLCALNSLAIAREALGSLDRVKRAVKATVYVASAPGFYDQPKVADGATDLLRELWGDEGLPARAAVGVASLPLDIAVELELLLEVA
jgi:enamine deaminase RidA (YjgF/YER057c/UK114 family)